MMTATRPLKQAIFLSLLILTVAVATPVYANDSSGERVSISTATPDSSLPGSERKESVVAELDALVKNGTREKTTRGSVQQDAVSVPNIDFWIYDASVDLYSDWDRDGYYVGIDLVFDADTIYSAAEVYAVVYLSYDFGPWNEYTSTDNFTILGASGNDAYRIETELLSGYATGEYDMLIELFDTYDGSFVASFGPEDSSNLGYLPLEDADRDTPQTQTVVVNQGGGGALGVLGLLALFSLVARRFLYAGNA